MDYFNLAIAGFVVLIALVKRELLAQERSYIVILVIAIILFLVGLLDIFMFLKSNEKYLNSGAFLCPLVTLIQYRLSRKLFLRLVEREPRDTSLDFGEGLTKDRFFNLLYFIPAFLLMLFFFTEMEILLGS